MPASRRSLRSVALTAALLAAGVAGGAGYAGALDLGSVRRAGLPVFAYRSAGAALAYRVALNRPDLLATLPCYCGCALMKPPHINLRECFLRPDGGFETHASGCAICQEEARSADGWAAAGAAAAEVRRLIDENYRTRGPAPPGFTEQESGTNGHQ